MVYYYAINIKAKRAGSLPGEKDKKRGGTETNIMVAINAHIYAHDCLLILS